MGIIVDSDTRVLVQGVTGTQGSFHTQLMQEYGTRILAGTSPGKGGGTVHGIPVFDTVLEAQKAKEANASIVFVPAPFATDAAFEALEAGIKTVIIITEHVPVKDAISLMSYAKDVKARIVGPNTPGVITPGRCKVGILPSHEFIEGNVGVVSRSGTLTYEIAAALTKTGIGQSTCVGVGGDPVTGLNFIETLDLFREDAKTKAVALIGEIGGNIEELTAKYITQEQYPKPVVAYIGGLSAPVGKRMGHAGAIIAGKTGTAQTKIEALETANVRVAKSPSDVAKMVAQALRTQ
jgi:succinyl-CoA synthetase alpha subunit